MTQEEGKDLGPLQGLSMEEMDHGNLLEWWKSLGNKCIPIFFIHDQKIHKSLVPIVPL